MSNGCWWGRVIASEFETEKWAKQPMKDFDICEFYFVKVFIVILNCGNSDGSQCAGAVGPYPYRLKG